MLSQDSNLRLPAQMIEQLQAGQVNRLLNPEQKGTQIYNQLEKLGLNDCVLLSMDTINVLNGDIFMAYATEAYQLFTSKGVLAPEMWAKCYNVLGHYGVALSGLFFGYDTNKDVMSLYTSSWGTIENLAKQNLIKPKKSLQEDLAKTQGELVLGSGMRKSLGENAIQCTKLTPLISGGSIKYEMSRAKLKLSDTLIIPYRGYMAAVKQLNSILEQRVVRVTMGDKVRDITTSGVVLETVYGKQRQQQLMQNYLRMFNPACRNLYFPSLGASVYTFGLTNIKLEYVDKLELLSSISQVDLSEVQLDLSEVKEYFFGVVKKFKAPQYREMLDEIGLDSIHMTVPEMKEQVKELEKWYDNEIWVLMKKLPKLFNTSEYISKPKKYGSTLTGLAIPSTVGELTNLFKEGLYKVCVQYASKGKETKLYTKYVSNDEKVLKKFLGANYYGTYESLGNRLKKLKSVCVSKNVDDIKAIRAMKKLKLYDDIEYNDIGDSLGINTVSAILERVEELQKEVLSNTTVVKQVDSVTVRNLKPQENKYGKLDYYINIKPENIVELYRVG